MNPLSITTLCFRSSQLTAALDGAVAAGFENVEVCAVKGFLEHVDPDDVTPSSIEQLRFELESRGLRATSISGHSDLIDPDGYARHHRLLQLCGSLGIPTLNTFAGAERRSLEDRQALISEARRLGDEARAIGVIVCFENDGSEAGTASEVATLLGEVNHPAVRMNYDPANSVFFGGADLKDDIPEALPWLGHVHLKDKRGGQDFMDFPPLGEGDLDLARVLRAVRESRYAGPICVEFEFDGNWPDWQGCVKAARTSRQHLQTIDASWA